MLILIDVLSQKKNTLADEMKRIKFHAKTIRLEYHERVIIFVFESHITCIILCTYIHLLPTYTVSYTLYMYILCPARDGVSVDRRGCFIFYYYCVFLYGRCMIRICINYIL